MERRIVLLGVFHSADQGRLFKEGTFFDVFGDFSQGLIYDAAGTDIEMADFGVADLAVRQADIFTRSTEEGMGIFFPKFRQDLEVCLGYGIIFWISLQPNPSMMINITGFLFAIVVFYSFL